MSNSRALVYRLLLAVSAALAALAVITLVPNPLASKPNVLGYRSVCSYAPASTALCAALAGIVCTIRARTVSPAAASARYRPFILPGAAAVALLAVAVAFGVRFAVVQAGFGDIIRKTAALSGVSNPPAVVGDGVRLATVTEGEISATVEVTVRDGRIESLRLTAGRSVEPQLARRLFDEVTRVQSTAVDAVSGATASSRVVLSAIEEALRKGP